MYARAQARCCRQWPPLISIGIACEARRNRLWVAGGGPVLAGTGAVRVYDASSGDLLANYDDVTGSPLGFSTT
jgi:hypothetical protein